MCKHDNALGTKRARKSPGCSSEILPPEGIKQILSQRNSHIVPESQFWPSLSAAGCKAELHAAPEGLPPARCWALCLEPGQAVSPRAGLPCCTQVDSRLGTAKLVLWWVAMGCLLPLGSGELREGFFELSGAWQFYALSWTDSLLDGVTSPWAAAKGRADVTSILPCVGLFGGSWSYQGSKEPHHPHSPSPSPGTAKVPVFQPNYT